MPTTGFWKGKRVLVTGHTGFKGSWLCLWLKSRGAEVSGLSLAPHTIPSLYGLAGVSDGLSSTIGDIRDSGVVLTSVRKARPEIIFHLAAQALVRASYRDPVSTYATNVMGTVHLLEATRVTEGVRAVVVVTSDKCYENREWVWGYRESDPVGGHDPYSSSKGCAELVTSAYRRSFFSASSATPVGLDVGLASARGGNVIGGGDWAEDRIIPDFVRAISRGAPLQVRHPGSIRPWQHVLEPLAGYMLLAEQLWTRPEKYAEAWNFGPNLGEAKPVSWIADYVVGRWGDGARWENVGSGKEPHEARSLKLDCSHARAELGWAPKLDLRKTLDWTTDWYRGWVRGERPLDLVLGQIEGYEKLEGDFDG